MPLAHLHPPFNNPDWIYELKYDGFRSLAYVEGGVARLLSRNRNTFKTFAGLATALGAAQAGQA